LVADFNEEYFLRREGLGGNKSIAGGAEGNARIAIFPAASTPASHTSIFQVGPGCCGENLRWHERYFSMARINELLRSAPSRIGQRIAQFVAIAAASLPDAGA
jgi:hypothetical protein